MEELNLAPEELEALLALGIKPEQLGLNKEDLDFAKEMRWGSGPEGRQAGRAYVAANPLEHLSRGIQRYQGKKDEKRLRGEREALLDETTRGRGIFGNLLRGKGMMSAVGTPPIAPPQVSGPEGGFPMPSVPPISPMASALRAGPQGPPPAPNPPAPAPVGANGLPTEPGTPMPGFSQRTRHPREGVGNLPPPQVKPLPPPPSPHNAPDPASAVGGWLVNYLRNYRKPA